MKVVQPEGLQSGGGGTLAWVMQTEENEILLVGIPPRIINFGLVMYDLGPERLCVHVLGRSAYVYMFGKEFLCYIRT
jgi:hypothetical protein